MVKGISRRVVVVDAPEHRFFEQAIFIVRNGRIFPDPLPGNQSQFCPGPS